MNLVGNNKCTDKYTCIPICERAVASSSSICNVCCIFIDELMCYAYDRHVRLMHNNEVKSYT